MAAYPEDRDTKATMYFHIQNKQEVRLMEAAIDTVLLPIRDRLTYYRTECTYPQDVNGSRFNDEQKSICLSHIDGRLRDLFAAIKEESSVDGILFQARFGNMYVTSPHQDNWDNAVVSTDYLQQMVHNKFSFSIPGSINLQTFTQNHCANISQVTRYKVQFKIFADDASSLVKAGCHIEEQGDKFIHIWTRTSTSVKDEIKDAWRDVRNIDIICPGRQIDMRIVNHFEMPCCPEDHPAHEIGERIARSMTRRSGRLYMQVAAKDFCVVFIRKKIIKKSSWLDPTQRNPGWTITELCAHNPRNMEYEYLRLRREKHYSPVPVDIDGRIVTELDFSGSTHATKPSDDPNSRVPTADEFVADFKMFVEASFCVADQLSMN